MEQAVFDLPMVARQLEQVCWIELVGRQAGDGVDDLARAAVFQFADALDPADRGDARPVFVEPRRQLGADGDAARFDSAVAFFDGLGALQIGRITPLVCLERRRGDDRLRGKRLRMPFRVRCAVAAGCL